MTDIHTLDLTPPLSNTPEDQGKWNRLLASITQHYCFWNGKHFQPKADHIFFNVGDGLKLPKDGTKFRSFASTCTKKTRWDVIPIIGVVWKQAWYEFGFSRAKQFNSLTRPDGILFKESYTKSVYSAEEIAKCLEGIDS